MLVARVLSAVLDKSFCKRFWYSSSIVNVHPTSVFRLLQEVFNCIFSSFSQWQHIYIPVMSIRTQSRAWGVDDSAKFFCCSINTVYYMAPYATMILSIPALLLEGPGVVKWAEVQTSLLLPVLIIVLSGVSAFCLNFSIFYVIHTTTAVTFNVAGNMKVCSCFSPQYLVQNATACWCTYY
jgi:hypothetical protein